MNGSRIPRSVVALALAVVGWAWLYAHINQPSAGKPAAAPTVATTLTQRTTRVTHTICGRALDAHGTPINGAMICLTREVLSDLDIPESQVIAQTRTGADGRFELIGNLDSPDKQSTGNCEHECEVWAWCSGFAVAHTSFIPEEPQPPLTLNFVEQSSLTIRLLRPDRSSCAGAAVTPVLLGIARQNRRIPKPIQACLQTHTGPGGEAKVVGWHGGRLGLAIETAEFGVQTALIWETKEDHRIIALRDTKTVNGRVALPKGSKADPSLLKLAVLQISRPEEINPRLEPGESQAGETSDVVWQDEREARPDREGRFTFTKLPNARNGTLHLKAAGLSALNLADDRDSQCLLAELPSGKVLKIDLPARKGVWTTWVARDAYTKQPLADVQVGLAASNEFRCSGRTDANGCLRVCLAAGETYAVDCQLPAGYLRTLFGPEAYVEIPGGVADCEPPPIELVRGCPIAGRAIDTTGRPLVGVRVQADWQTRETKAGKKPSDVRQWAVTDSDGRFRFEQVEAGANVRLTTTRAGVLVAEPAAIVAGDGKTIVVQEANHELVALTGRILGSNRKPLVGASVAIEVADSVDSLGQFGVTTDADGSFRTPPQYPRQLKYRITVCSLLTPIASSAWWCPADGGLRFPDFVVDSSNISPTSRLTGQEVVARVNGQPIHASELLERAAAEPLNAAGLTLLLARKRLASGTIDEPDFRALQETAIKRYLANYVRTRLLSQCYLQHHDQQQLRKVEAAVDREFDNYVVKLERDFDVRSPREVEEKLRQQGTSLASLKAEFRCHLFADEYLRGSVQSASPVDRPRVWAYYQSHRDRYATPEKVTWQLLEINFDRRPFGDSKTTASKARSSDSRSEMAVYRKIGHELGLGVADDEVKPASSTDDFSLKMLKGGRLNAEESKQIAKAEQLAEADLVADSPKSDAQQEGFVWSDEMRELHGRKNGLKVLDDALACLRKGESFAAVTKKFSDGPRAEEGGWQRPTRPESIVDAKTAAILHKLAEGETSSVIETEHAFRIIRLVTRLPASRVPFEDVEDRICQQLNQERSQQALDMLISRATIESAFPLDESWKQVTWSRDPVAETQ